MNDAKSKKSMKQKLEEAALKVRVFGSGIKVISKALRDTVPPVLEDLAATLKLAYGHAYDLQMLKNGHLVDLVGKLRGADLESEHAAAVVTAILQRDAAADSQRTALLFTYLPDIGKSLLPNMIDRATRTAVDALMKSSKAEDILKVVLEQGVCVEPFPIPEEES